MNKSEIIAKFDEVLIDRLGVEPEDIKPEAKLQDELGADSLDLVDLLMSTEQAFGIAISDDEWEKLETVQQCYDFIESKLGN